MTPEPDDAGGDASTAAPAAREPVDTPASAARRRFLIESSALTTGIAAAPYLSTGQAAERDASVRAAPAAAPQRVAFEVNGATRELTVDPRVTLLDALREHLRLTGTKKGCDRGQCGACTVLVDGRRVNAVPDARRRRTTATRSRRSKGSRSGEHAAPDAGGVHRARRLPVRLLHARADLLGRRADRRGAGRASARPRRRARAGALPLTDDEIRERMSGNICRCGAYSNIVAAVQDVARPGAGLTRMQPFDYVARPRRRRRARGAARAAARSSSPAARTCST